MARKPISTGEAAAGRVVLVGAGPGDPELLTLKALRAIRSAEVIFTDRLVGADILELVEPGSGTPVPPGYT